MHTCKSMSAFLLLGKTTNRAVKLSSTQPGCYYICYYLFQSESQCGGVSRNQRLPLGFLQCMLVLQPLDSFSQAYDYGLD